jgi:hypothetical protein
MTTKFYHQSIVRLVSQLIIDGLRNQDEVGVLTEGEDFNQQLEWERLQRGFPGREHGTFISWRALRPGWTRPSATVKRHDFFINSELDRF